VGAALTALQFSLETNYNSVKFVYVTLTVPYKTNPDFYGFRAVV
jgi:hypothetical protein